MPLLDLVLKATVLLAVAGVACLLARRAAAAHRHLILTLAMCGALALPILALLPWRLPLLPSREVAPPAPVATRDLAAAPVAPAAISPSVQPRASDPATLPPLFPASSVEALTVFPRSSLLAPRSPIPIQRLLLVLWAAGAAWSLVRLARSAGALRRIMRGARDVGETAWRQALEPALARLGVSVPVRLVRSDRTVMPMTFGVVKPVVVLPHDADEWPAGLRRVVLLHELAHVRRKDALINIASQVACAVYWFHPLAWVAARQLRHEAERACDDLVLAAGAPPSSYAGHLLQMLQAALSRRAPAFALPMAQRSAFEGRVLAILAPDVARHALTRRAVLAGAAVLALVALPLAALTAKPRPEQREPGTMLPAVVAPNTPASGTTVPPNGDGDAKPAGQVTADTAAATDDAADSDELVPQNPAAGVALIGALGDDDATVREAAARALGERGDTAAINALLSALRRDASREVRKAAAWALGEIEDARAVPGLLAALREERDREVRGLIVRALGEIESDAAVVGLGALLRTEDETEMRKNIVWALGEIESADAVPFLLPLLRDGNAEVRALTVWALGEIESPAAVDGLVGMMNSERDPTVRERIVWALGEIEDPRAAPALEAALRDSSAELRRSAARALGELDGLRTMPPVLIAAMRDTDAEVRINAARAAGEIQDVAAVPALVGLLRDGSLDVRREAVRALGEMRSASAAEALVGALRDEDPEIRRLAAQALGNRE